MIWPLDCILVHASMHVLCGQMPEGDLMDWVISLTTC